MFLCIVHNWQKLQDMFLAVIIGRIVEKIYCVRRKPASATRRHMHELEVQLQQWLVNLPEPLAYYIASNRPVPPPHILTLHCQYWGAVILLHRRLSVPVLYNRYKHHYVTVLHHFLQHTAEAEARMTHCSTGRRALTLFT